MWKTGVGWLLSNSSRCQRIKLRRSLLFFSNGRDLQTFRNHYEVSCSHSPPSHSCTHRLYLLLLSGAQNKEGKMLKTVWTFLGMLCTLSIAGLFLGSSHNSSPPCFFHIICQYLYNKNLEFSIIPCAVIFPHLVAGVCQTCSE